jgi:uncharacterized damage-inducible protein DinB
MFERERRLFTFNLNVLERLMEDVTDDELSKQPLPGMNTPRWIIGHLSMATDVCLRMLGRETVLPEAWHTSFGPGSTPNAEGAPTPSKAELLEALQGGHARLLAAIEQAEESTLNEPHGVRFESLQKVLPKKGDLLAHMMSNHEAFHIGQLSAWRRTTGRRALF